MALHKTGSTGLVESFMATHTHQMVQTDDPDGFMYNFRLPYCMYFNHKYHRSGRLGEKLHFTTYAYPHCSANSIFRKEMGKFQEERILPPKSIYKYIGRRAECPPSYKMGESGLFLRESVLDIPQVQNMFGTPRSFNFYMTRKSGEEWEKEQTKDGNGTAPVNLDLIERGVDLHDIGKMMIFENGKADYRKVSDIELCTELDALARLRFNRHSVYQLTDNEKTKIANELYYERHIGLAQIRRCLAML